MKRGRKLTRRQVIKLAGGVVVLVGCGGKGLDLDFKEVDTFDEVLDKMHATAPEFDDGLSNHATMAAEALVTLGRADRVVSYVDGYSEQLHLLDADEPLPEDEREGALGDYSRVAQWIASYEDELVDRFAPRDVLLRDWAMLAPGYAAAGFHGVLRAAHAVRSLERRASVSRKRELAHALGYWAAKHVTLPGEPGSRRTRGFDVLSALKEIEKVSGSDAEPKETIYERMSWVDGDESFLDIVETVDLDALPVSEAITELTAAASRILVDTGGNNIGYLHAVTGTSALRLLLPWLDMDGARLGLGYAFQCVAAVHATYSSEPGVPDPPVRTTHDVDEIQARAGRADDPHGVKLGEAAIREYQYAKRPELLEAAHEWLKRTG